MLFNTSSQSARRATANTLDCLARGDARQRQILDLLCSFLDEVTEAGEHAQEFLELLKKLTDDKDSKWKTYLAMRGVLPKIGTLIGKVSKYSHIHVHVLRVTYDLYRKLLVCWNSRKPV